MITSTPNSTSTETAATAKMAEIAESGRMAACFERLRGENRAGLVTFITGGDPVGAHAAVQNGLLAVIRNFRNPVDHLETVFNLLLIRGQH